MGKLSHKVAVPRPHGGVELVSSLRLDLLVKVDLHHGQVAAHQSRLSSWVAGDSFPSWWGQSMAGSSVLASWRTSEAVGT